MTPPPNPRENYNIDDLNSGDDTDDDEAPRKKIPDWAQGTVNIQKILTPEKIDVFILKFEHDSFTKE